MNPQNVCVFYICMVVVFSCQVVPNSLQPHGLQHNRLPCSSPSSGVSPSSCPLNQWCHPIISSSVIPLSFCPQSFTASGSLPMSQLFTSGGQSIGASATFLRCQCLPLPSPAWPHPIYLDSWTTHSRFLCNTFLYSIGFYFLPKGSITHAYLRSFIALPLRNLFLWHVSRKLIQLLN